jgi:two-component system sensor histidine kinase YesM
MKQMTLLRRIFVLVGGVFFGLLATTTIVIYFFFSNLLITNAQDYLHLIMQQNQRMVNTSLKRVEEVVVGLNNDRFIYEQVALPVSDNYVDHAVSRQEINRYLIRSVYVPLRKYFGEVNYWFFINDQYQSSTLYTSYSFPANRVLTMKRAREMAFFAATQSAKGRVWWFMNADKPHKIYAAVLLRGTFSATTIPDIGVLLLEFNVVDLLGTDTDNGSQSEYYLVDAQGGVHRVSKRDAPTESLPAQQFLQEYFLNAPQTVNQTFQANNQLFSILALDSGWWLVGVTPFSQITQQTHRLSEFLIPVTVMSLAAVVVLSYVIARSVAHPIVHLSHTMRQSTQQSDLVVSLPTRPQPIEITLLYEAYNEFITRIKQLLQDVYYTGLNVKQAELRALQAQINPHFLYNTLDAISWITFDLGDNDVPHVVSSLSNILRYSINDSDRLVTLTEELNIVRDYLNIQSFCYQLDIQLVIDDGLPSATQLLPKLTLQPIIENAVQHGFLEQKQKTGIIAIRYHQTEVFAQCEIENPGEADVAMMNKLLQDTSEPKKHGIRNVHNRLRMLFGADSGLYFYQTPQHATVAVLTIYHPSSEHPVTI